MPAGFLRLALSIACGLWPLTATCGQAQSEPPAPAETSSREQRSAEPGPLDTILLRDSKGNLVPVLGMPFEEFERLLRLKRGLAPASPPGFIVESLTLDGTVNDDVASLELKIAVNVREEGWVSVPLYMATAVIRNPLRYEGPGQHLWSFDAAEGGQVLWLNGKSEQPHVISIPVAFRAALAGGQRRLAARLPRATESSLRLSTATAAAETVLVSGEGILSVRSTSHGGSEISVVGAAGDVQLTWRDRGNAVARSGPQVEVAGEITVRVESEHSIAAEARLRVRNLSGPLESFVVRLPPGMELVPLPAAAGYSVIPLDQLDGVGQSAPDAVVHRVEVRLDRPTTTMAEVLLRTQRTPSAAAGNAILPVRFDVAGAVRQRGTIDFVTEGEWHLNWKDDPSVHRQDVPPGAAEAHVVARYEYFHQPCDLELTVAARPSRLSVEPTHMVYVHPQQVRIETMLKCRFRGARADGLRLEMDEWDFDRITPDALFDLPVISERGEVFLPFRPGATVPADIEMKLEAHRPAPANERLAFAFPRPQASNIAPATILIFAADNVELTPRMGEVVGLSSDPTTVRLPGRQQPPVVFRDLGGGERALFVAGVRTLTRVTSVAARARVRIDGQQMQIDQQLDYRVAHEGQRTFLLTAPKEVIVGDSLQVWLGGELLGVSAAPSEPATDAALAQLTIATPTDQIGPFQLSVRYSLPLRWNRREALLLAIPLVMPVVKGEDRVTGQQIEFVLPDNVQVEPDVDEVDELNRPSTVSGSPLTYAWSNPIHTSHWILELSQSAEGAAISVPQMWIQTWFSPRIRQERVAFRIKTSRDTVLVRVPRGVKQSGVQTAVDGRLAPRLFRDPGALVVMLPVGTRGRECVLEISYTIDSPPSFLGLLNDQWRSPQIEDAEAPRRLFWQLIIPENQHLILPPSELTAEMAWSTGAWPSSRRPVLDQRQLEAWIKATPQEPLPRSSNVYLYGTLARWPALRVTIAHRVAMVIAASGIILVVGLVAIHVPAVRRPELGLLLAVLIAALAVVEPELAWLAAQGSLMGAGIAVLAAVWARISAAEPRAAMPLSTIATRSPDAASTESPAPRAERSSRITTTSPGAAAILEVRP